MNYSQSFPKLEVIKDSPIPVQALSKTKPDITPSHIPLAMKSILVSNENQGILSAIAEFTKPPSWGKWEGKLTFLANIGNTG